MKNFKKIAAIAVAVLVLFVLFVPAESQQYFLSSQIFNQIFDSISRSIRVSVNIEEVTGDHTVGGNLEVAGTADIGGDVGITGELTWDGDLIYAYEDVDAESYTLQAGDKVLGVSYSATGATSIIIPTLQVVEGRLIIVKDTGGNADPNTITVSTEGSEKIDGADIKTITSDYGMLRLLCDGSHCFTW